MDEKDVAGMTEKGLVVLRQDELAADEQFQGEGPGIRTVAPESSVGFVISGKGYIEGAFQVDVPQQHARKMVARIAADVAALQNFSVNDA